MRKNNIPVWLLIGTLLFTVGCGGSDHPTGTVSSEETESFSEEVQRTQEELVDITYGLPGAGEGALLQSDPALSEDSQEEAEALAEPVSGEGAIRIATVGEPNLEILEKAASLLKQEGYELVIRVCDDYDSPNALLAEGQVEVNFYQHTAFLERYNQEKGTDLAVLEPIYYEPLAIYPGKTDSLEEVPPGAVIGVPSNPTAYAKSLFLLQQAGLIKLMEDTDLTAVWEDVVNNPLGLELVEYEEKELPTLLDELELAVFHPGYALEQGIDPADRLLQENEDSFPTALLAQVLAVKEGTIDEGTKEAVTALIRVLKSEEMKEFIGKKYQGSILIWSEAEPSVEESSQAAE